VPARRNYHQNCPFARGLDVLGERWTLLILRELLGGPRRYSDLR
jgi:DNA-binding HxlR family transcriptional regulator